VTVFVVAHLAPDFDGQTLKGTFAGWLIGRADWPRDDDRPLVRFVIEFAFGPPATLNACNGKARWGATLTETDNLEEHCLPLSSSQTKGRGIKLRPLGGGDKGVCKNQLKNLLG
jgi:hypothetical protein